MSLREQVQADVWKIFFNTHELAQERKINGKLVCVIEDGEQLQKYKQQGICEGTMLLYIPFGGDKGLGYLPEAGDAIMYGNRKYEVETASMDGGVIRLILKQQRGF